MAEVIKLVLLVAFAIFFINQNMMFYLQTSQFVLVLHKKQTIFFQLRW